MTAPADRPRREFLPKKDGPYDGFETRRLERDLGRKNLGAELLLYLAKRAVAHGDEISWSHYQIHLLGSQARLVFFIQSHGEPRDEGAAFGKRVHLGHPQRLGAVLDRERSEAERVRSRASAPSCGRRMSAQITDAGSLRCSSNSLGEIYRTRPSVESVRTRISSRPSSTSSPLPGLGSPPAGFQTPMWPSSLLFRRLSGKIPLRVARRPGTGQLDAVRATPLMSLTRPHQRPPASPSPSRLLSLSADLERELQLIALPLPYQGCSSHV